jgi:hypothetical protein
MRSPYEMFLEGKDPRFSKIGFSLDSREWGQASDNLFMSSEKRSKTLINRLIIVFDIVKFVFI